MKHLDENNVKKVNTVLLVLVIVLSITVAVLLLLLLKPKVETPAPTEAETAAVEETAVAEETTVPVETEVPTLPEIQETVPVIAEEFSVATPYCELYLPVEWDGQIKTDDMKVDTMYAVTFLGVLEHKEVPLYTVLFDKGERQKTALGSLQTDSGAVVWVYLEMSQLEQDKTLSAEEYDVLLSMQETVNHLLEKLTEVDAYTAA